MGSKHGAEPSFRKPSWKHGASTTVKRPSWYPPRVGVPRQSIDRHGLPTAGEIPRRSKDHRGSSPVRDTTTVFKKLSWYPYRENLKITREACALECGPNFAP
ncbi:hypothetical protein TIFTF001_015126 [Ficus carica]|uniref:Uncharacterized protein n=1 Tax=Ficus carica TaxID=3494 RepID=A0AA88A799_FICCA|nr:hypothetical protein TIFTF001_015126 [Ficus carica]